jgi:tetratricopeptide (TPR) repeat protein
MILKLLDIRFWQYLLVFWKADGLISKEKYNEAINVIENFLEKKIYATEAIYYILGIAHYKAKNYNLAKESFELSIENNKFENNSKANTYFYLGLTVFESEEYKEAIRCFKTAINIKSECLDSKDNVISVPSLYCYLGRVYKKNNEIQQAFSAFNEGLKHCPNHEALQREITLLGIG